MAAKLAVVDYEELEATLTIDDALARDTDILPTRQMCLGDPEAAIERARHRLQETFYTGGQDHFYLEGQIAMAVPGEDRDLLVYSSTQHPSMPRGGADERQAGARRTGRRLARGSRDASPPRCERAARRVQPPPRSTLP